MLERLSFAARLSLGLIISFLIIALIVLRRIVNLITGRVVVIVATARLRLASGRRRAPVRCIIFLFVHSDSPKQKPCVVF